MAKGTEGNTSHRGASRALLTIAMVALLIGAFHTIQLYSDDSSGESTSIVLNELVEFNDYPGIYEIHWEGSINGSTIIQSDVYASLVGVRIPTDSPNSLKMEFPENIRVESIKHEGVEIFSGNVPVTKWDIGKNESNFLFEGYDENSYIPMEFVMPKTILYVNPDIAFSREFTLVKSISFDKDNPNYMFDNEDGLLYRIIDDDSKELVAFFAGMAFDKELYDLDKLEPLTIDLQDSVKIIRDNAFFWIQLYGWGESEINISSNSKLEKIGTGGLSYATIKFEGTFPSTLKYIESSAFVSSTIRGITSADFLPSGLIELGGSEDSPFSGCIFITNTDYSFDTITIPSSLEFIANDCFDDFLILTENYDDVDNWKCTFIIEHRNIYAPGYAPLTIEKDAFGAAYDYNDNYVYPHNIIFENDDLYSFSVARNLANQTEYNADRFIEYILNLSDSATFDLVWNFKEVNVTLNPCDGKFDDGATESKTIVMNYSCPFGVLPEPKRVGCTFEGWYTAKTGGEKVSAKSIVETDEGFTLYAHWSGNNHVVNFVADGADHVPEQATIEYSKPFVNILPTVEKKYHTFSHWSLDIEGKERVNADTCATLADDEYDVNHVFILYANFEPILYTITFDTTGGSPMDLISQPYGTNVEKPADPTKTGYRFAGWDRNIPATMPAENITITARWNINQYTITFDTIGGSDIASITQDFGSAITKPFDPTRVGYTFTGWDRDIPATMPAENITITAKWDANQYTITFKIDERTTMAVIEQDCDSVITKPIDPTKVGYSFAGWDKDVPATMPAENITLTAKWRINQYTITFDTAGGSDIASITQDFDTAITKPKNPSRTGYSFAGWDKDVPANMPAEDVTITAKWTVNQYTITFNTIGGSAVNSITQNFGSTITEPDAPTKVGHTFLGWSPSIPETITQDITCVAQWSINHYTITFSTGGGSIVKPISQEYGTDVQAPKSPSRTGYTFAGWDKEIPATIPAENITITAKWTINQYTITFDTAGGTAIASITKDFGSAITKPSDPTKVGYTFAGWDKDVPATMPAENMTLTAKWIANKYTITFDTAGGTAIDNITQDFDTAIVKPENPSRTGYTFTGWDKEIPSTIPAENITITAKWTINQYTITFDTAGGSAIASITQDFDTAITKPKNPSRTGYTFAGWDMDVPTNMPAENVTITAKWTINTYKVTWVNENGDVLAEDVVKYNVKPAYSGDEPIKTPTAQYSYAFNGWSPEIVAATEDTTYIATFTPTINRYTVTWVNHDGTVLETDRNVEYGTTPTYDGATPTKAANVQYTFSFKGWDNPPSTVKGDTTYRAVFNSFVKEYTITFDTKGGSTVEPITLSYGTSVQAPADPTRTGHTFLGWTPGIPDEMTEDITCVALWAPFTYTVVFDNNGGTGSMDNITLEYAKDGKIPQCTFTRTEHRFLAWNTAADGSGTTYQDGSTIRHLGLENGETITLYAMWKINQYPVHFTVDGVDIPGYPIMSDYGSSITAPDAPTKDSTDEYDFIFIEWIGYVASIKVTGEMYFNAAFSASPIVEPEVADGKVVFDVNELEGITLSTKIIQDIEASFQDNEELRIVFELNGGIIELDKKAFDMLEGDELISIINVPTSNMPGTILNKVQDRPVFDISMGDVHNFGGGKLSISLHYDLKENEDADNIRIWHFDNEGNHTVTRCTYDLDSETVTFTVNSLSYFSIMYEEDEEPETSSFGSTVYVILSIVMIVALFGAIMMYSKKS